MKINNLKEATPSANMGIQKAYNPLKKIKVVV